VDTWSLTVSQSTTLLWRIAPSHPGRAESGHHARGPRSGHLPLLSLYAAREKVPGASVPESRENQRPCTEIDYTTSMIIDEDPRRGLLFY